MSHDQSYTTNIVQSPVHASIHGTSSCGCNTTLHESQTEHGHQHHMRVCLEHHLHSGVRCLARLSFCATCLEWASSIWLGFLIVPCAPAGMIDARDTPPEQSRAWSMHCALQPVEIEFQKGCTRPHLDMRPCTPVPLQYVHANAWDGLQDCRHRDKKRNDAKRPRDRALVMGVRVISQLVLRYRRRILVISVTVAA